MAPRERRNEAGIGDVISYLISEADLTSVGGIFCVIVLVAIFGMGIYFIKGVQGDRCSSARLNMGDEDTITHNIGCLVFRFVNLFPFGFDDGEQIDLDDDQPAGSGNNIVSPSTPAESAPPSLSEEELRRIVREELGTATPEQP